MIERLGGAVVIAENELAVDPNFESTGKLSLKIDLTKCVPINMGVEVGDTSPAVKNWF